MGDVGIPLRDQLVHARRDTKAEKSPLKLMIWTAFAGLIFALMGFGEIAEDQLRAARNRLHVHPASGDIVIVGIDDRSLSEIGSWPWPRRHYAQLAEQLTQGGAKRIFFDVTFDGPSNPRDDQILADALERSSPATIPVRLRSGPAGGTDGAAVPLDLIARNATLGSISVYYNYQNAVWRLSYGGEYQGGLIPSYAAKLAGRTAAPGEFMIDYSVDPRTVPFVSAAAVQAGEVQHGIFAGKDIIVAPTSEILGDQYFLPGWGKMAGAYVQVIGAETLKSGRPLHLGWIVPFLLALAVAAFALSRRSPVHQYAVLGAAAMALLLVPASLEAKLVFVDITPALLVTFSIAAVLGWRRYRRRGLINAVSELPNLSALRAHRPGRDQALIAARVLNYAEIVSTLPPESERQLVDQIVSKLKIGAAERILYHGDDGIFAWFEESGLPFGNHLEALHSLFRSPARLSGVSVDLSVSFGVEIGSSRSLASRLASAIVAAEEAAHHGLKWKIHDPETLQDASWKLSMLSQLDDAVDKGEIWVAYQPKLDIARREIVGAEALARWTHPEKGPIAASEFIGAAEQNDRIGKLTDFVLEKAVAAAAEINARRPGFGMAVNLSARLLSDKGFVLRLSAMLARHGLPANRLTLELTETAALAGSGSAVEMLATLRDMGVTISIDDYGTGLSTLEYLKKIPAREIKIDQSFVKAMLENRSDRLMVQSTIALAHSLGRKVVAEGVEQREVLDALVEMKCDIAQGFAIGRPMSLEALIKRITVQRRRQVA